MPLQILIQFAQTHPNFRIPELLSVASTYLFEIGLPPAPDLTRPFMVVTLQQEGHARLLAERCILVKSVHELYATAESYPSLHELNREQSHRWASYKNIPWKFMVTGYNRSISKSRQCEIVEGFSYMALEGCIDLTNPDIELWCFEEYGAKSKEALPPLHGNDRSLRQIWFGKLIAHGTARRLIQKFDVKKRAYFGNTSMDAEMSLLMANQTLTAAHFGAWVFGSDIDGRQIRGKGRTPGVLRSASQYGLERHILDLCTFDVTRNPWRCGGLFDAIVTDPPYGVRAGAKRLGRKPGVPMRDSVTAMSDPSTYVPPTHPYELATLVADLMLLARYLLKPHGRLVFFLPTVSEQYADVDIPRLEGMQLIANSLESFGAWGRRLITMVKTEEMHRGPPDLRVCTEGSVVRDKHVPAHKDFRGKYFAGFGGSKEG